MVARVVPFCCASPTMAAGDAALLAAAVKAAIQAKASRRTTAAIAAAVASALASAAASAEATAALGKPAGATRPSAPPPDGFSLEELGERQRASRRARRKRQRERKRRAAETATSRDVAPEGQAMEVEPAAPPPAAARELQPQALKREHHAQLGERAGTGTGELGPAVAAAQLEPEEILAGNSPRASLQSRSSSRVGSPYSTHTRLSHLPPLPGEKRQ